MGQYYTPIIKEVATGKKYNVDMTYAEGDFVGLKLTEHSWWDNTLCNVIDTILYKSKYQVAWVGDYADKEDKANLSEIVAEPQETIQVSYMQDEPTELFGLYLCNHSKKLYIDCNDYYEKSENDEGWHTHPLPLLTCIGNGKGGGDYFSEVCADLVGTWAWDIISIETEPPKDYKQLECGFYEEY
jgi:hypothetical protein